MNDFKKNTAVISVSNLKFQIWAKQRGIVRVQYGKYRDSAGEQYTCVTEKEDVYGMLFTDVEFVDGYVTDKMMEIEELIKLRMR